MSTISASPMTLEEFSDLDDTRGLKLVDGRVEELCVEAESTMIAKILTDAAEAHAVASQAGLVMPNDIGIDLRRLGGQLLRKPDGMFIRKGRLVGNRPPLGWLEVIPDIAWEVVSPGDRVEALERKLGDYREARIPLVWVIYPGTRTARIQRPDGPVAFIDSEGYLDGDEILPGFRIRLGEVFERYEARIARLNEPEASEQ